MGMSCSDLCCVVGVDGGGSKTEAVALDCAGRIAATGLGGSVNTTFVSEHTALQSVRDALTAVAEAGVVVSRVCAVGVCLIGGRHLAEGILSEFGFSGRYFVYGESDVAFRRAGLSANVGIAVIAGTGSSFRGSNGSEAAALGGWGMAVGDEGSAFDIGLKAIKAAGRSQDRRGPETRLFELLLEHSGSSKFNDVLRKYCRPSLKQREIAAVAGLVTQAAGEGDEVARGILLEAGRSLGDDAAHVARRLFQSDEEFDIVFSGGVFNAGEFVTRSLEGRVRQEFPRARFHMPIMTAGEAVARLTLESLMSSASPSAQDTRSPA